MSRFIAILMVASLALGACSHPSQNAYRADEVGKTSTVSFGSVIAVREVDIIGENTGTGALIAGAAGAGAGAYVGSGSGTAWAVGAGLIAGLVAGALAEQAMSDRTGLEYTVILESGVTLTVVQEVVAGEPVLQPGERVIVQNTGGYQRVLSATTLPTEVEQPQGIAFSEAQ